MWNDPGGRRPPEPPPWWKLINTVGAIFGFVSALICGQWLYLKTEVFAGGVISDLYGAEYVYYAMFAWWLACVAFTGFVARAGFIALATLVALAATRMVLKYGFAF